jgi:membrane protease YdiL (CAAX protease family)
VLLLLIIGPAEELFWRGYVQRTMTKLHDPNIAFIVTTIIYALVHIWSGNFMLVMAALTAGAVWGLLYRFFPKSLPALVVSHALWDALVFVIVPI